MKRISFARALVAALAASLFAADYPAQQPPPGSRGRAADFPRYDLSVVVRPEERRLEGTGTALLPPAAERRETLSVGLSEQMSDFKVEVLEPAECAGEAKLELKETRDTPAGRTHIWTARPARALPAGKPVRLRLAWGGGGKTSFVFHLGPEGSFASGVNTAWYPVFETRYGTGTLRVSVPAGHTVHASGSRRGTEEEMRQGRFHFESGVPTYFAFAAAKYTVVRREGRVPVSLYLMRPRPNAERYLNGSLKTLEVLEREFGPYPYGEFAVVEVPEAEAERAGFTGASVEGFIMAVGSFLDQEFNYAYYGHEIAHQWWGNLVKFRGERGRYMIDEAMAQYGSLRVVETVEGAAAAEQYRRTGYPGYYAQQSGFGYLVEAASGADHPLTELHKAKNFRLLTNSKGFFVWDILARTVGREKFARILGDFTARHAFQSITWDELLDAISKGAGRDLRWFYEQWFERAGVPDWQLSWKQEGRRLRLAVTQSAPYYRAAVEVRAEGDGGKQQSRTVEIDGPRTEVDWPVGFPVRAVALDPNFMYLRWTPEYRAKAEEEARKKTAARQPSPQQPSDAERELIEAENKLVEAVMRADAEGLRGALADEFTATRLTKWAEVESREQFVKTALQMASQLTQKTFSFDQTRVRVLDGAAVVNTILNVKGSAAGRDVTMRYLILDVWIKRGGRWLLAARHLENAPNP